MPVYQAAWILPVSAPPVRAGRVAIDNGLVAAVGGDTADGAIDLGRVAVLPALVNAHTHLELSHLRALVPPASSFLEWIHPLIAARQRYLDPRHPDIVTAARTAIREARASGTGLIGDISNTLVTIPLLHEEGMPARVFYELLGFDVEDSSDRLQAARAAIDVARVGAPDIPVTLAPHAPYSVSPALFRAIRADLDRSGGVSSVHLAESPEEVRFVATGAGPWRDLLEQLGLWTGRWAAPGCSPVRYLSDLGFLGPQVLSVHMVQCGEEDLAELKTRGGTVVSCPRSNRHVGVGDPPLASFYAAGVPVAFGTDSLASAPDLNMFAELAAARRVAPAVPARTLIESATLAGATALGFGDRFGSIEAGKHADLIAVRLPEGVDDVEEYLVGGIEPDTIAWLEHAPTSRQAL